METIQRKNRIRLVRGKLKTFDDLPNDVKEKFLVIKKSFQEIINDFDIKLYVFGSYYWGFWDEESDYDINLEIDQIKLNFEERIEIFKKIKLFIEEKYNIKLDIVGNRGEMGVLIP